MAKHAARLMEVPKIGKYFEGVVVDDYPKKVKKGPGFVANCVETGCETIAFPGDGWSRYHEEAPKDPMNRVVWALDLHCFREGYGHTHVVEE